MFNPIFNQRKFGFDAGHVTFTPPHAISGLLFYQESPLWKRFVDISGALVCIILFSPIMLAAALMVKLTSKGPVLFRQIRGGLGGKPFVFFSPAARPGTHQPRP